jgi:predicted transcriptional regulator
MPVDWEKLDSLKLETSSFKVLCYLSFRESALKPSEISQGIEEKPSTVRARLTELKNAGLVEAKQGGYISVLTPYDILMKFHGEVLKKVKG